MKTAARFLLALTVCTVVAIPLLVAAFAIYIYALIPDFPRKGDLDH